MSRWVIVTSLILATGVQAWAGSIENNTEDYKKTLREIRKTMAAYQPHDSGFVDYNVGSALNAENVKSATIWEVRIGHRRIQPFENIAADVSIGFSNYASNNIEAAPDRLVPGDLYLRTFNHEIGFSYHFHPVVFRMGGGVGWTWIQHSAGKNIQLSNLNPYEPTDRVIDVQESVHDALSATFRTGVEFEITSSFLLGVDARYLMLHTSRTRDVLIAGDRSYIDHTNSPVSFDHWTLALQGKWMF